ncbi:hypothetical protein CYMTET_10919 [Cymbomonas tetramitiformis]|uniref:Uncharacterized protein n=1 Tax=Cymbomonas tetramitiformis TaxID=36881 RepID=A0AAE0GN69_9CHLO|nr:hypothetical protein CYMTET_10919 [Cymbomonas tetramitiformis]
MESESDSSSPSLCSSPSDASPVSANSPPAKKEGAMLGPSAQTDACLTGISSTPPGNSSVGGQNTASRDALSGPPLTIAAEPPTPPHGGARACDAYHHLAEAARAAARPPRPTHMPR